MRQVWMHAPSTLITDCGLIIMKTVQNAEISVDQLNVFIQQSCGCSRILKVGFFLVIFSLSLECCSHAAYCFSLSWYLFWQEVYFPQPQKWHDQLRVRGFESKIRTIWGSVIVYDECIVHDDIVFQTLESLFLAVHTRFTGLWCLHLSFPLNQDRVLKSWDEYLLLTKCTKGGQL